MLVAWAERSYQLSQRRACRAIEAARSTVQYIAVRPPQDALRARLRELAGVRVSYGYPRLTILLRREGWHVDKKRVYRLYRRLENSAGIVLIAGYIEKLGELYSKPTVKQRLAAIRMLLDYLVTGGVLPFNPASSVRGPKHVVKRGKTPVLSAAEARQLLDSIPTTLEDGSPDVVGLRDRALIGLMVFSFARVGAALSMKTEDYFAQGKRWWFRLHEKGGKRHEVPAHHNAEAYLDAYLKAAGHAGLKKSPLFRTARGKTKTLTDEPMSRSDVLRMIRRRAKAAGLATVVSCHTFRATGITTYLMNGGTIENAQTIAAHESPRTTKLYDRRNDEITLDEVERIAI